MLWVTNSTVGAAAPPRVEKLGSACGNGSRVQRQNGSSIKSPRGLVVSAAQCRRAGACHAGEFVRILA